MVHPIVSGIATGVGLLTDKYMLQVTNFVDELSDLHATDFQKEFVKAAMYGGAVLGMVLFGPLSDYVGRRVCLIACSVITLLGAIGSTLTPNESFLIACRILTGFGMGGEYPLAATHSCESGETKDGGRNVALLYLFGSGLGQASCPFTVWLLLKMSVPYNLVWRFTFGVGALLAAAGLVLRIYCTQDSDKFKEACRARDQSDIPPWAALAAVPLAGTAFSWFLFDIVEYGLKQNDAAIFTSATDSYEDSVFTVFLTRLLVVPSLILASILPQYMAIKWMQLVGFAGTALVNFILMQQYGSLKSGPMWIFGLVYVLQLSFQSLPGVTTMAVPAEIFPAAIKGTGHGISAAMGKVGATVGSYFFALLKDRGAISTIFGAVFGASLMASLVTLALTPHYNARTLDLMEQLAREGREAQAVKVLYSGPQKECLKDNEDGEGDAEEQSSSSEE